MRKLRYLSFILLCCVSASVFAATPNPVSMLKGTTSKLISALKQNRSKLRSQPSYVYKIVDKVLLPQVDTIVMAQSVLGRTGWRKATPAQRREFTNEFTNTVIRTYASALSAYTNEKVVFSPLRGGYQGRQVIQINSKIMRQNGPPVAITYSVILRNGKWKIFDLNVEGISLLQSFRSQFSAQLSGGDSMAKIIQNLKNHNTKIGKK